MRNAEPQGNSECGMWNGPHPNPLPRGEGEERRRRDYRAFSLFEILLTIGLLALIMALTLPVLLREVAAERLPESARELRSLIGLVRARAMMDGKRYRMRFVPPEESSPLPEARQPIIEREDAPFDDPNVYELVEEPWATEATLHTKVRCIQVRLGKPVLEDELIEQMQKEFALRMEGMVDDFDPDFPPLDIDLNGRSEWVTYVLTSLPPEQTDDADESDLPIGSVIEVIADGMSGLAWLQRPFTDAEKEMLKANDWPPVLRQDFLRTQLLTEDDVLEIEESKIRQ